MIEIFLPLIKKTINNRNQCKIDIIKTRTKTSENCFNPDAIISSVSSI